MLVGFPARAPDRKGKSPNQGKTDLDTRVIADVWRDTYDR